MALGDQKDIDLRAAINAISDVVQNRPRPLRIFDQIYMKAGDMVLQSELVARWADGKKLAFIGDGDAISVCVAYLHSREILGYGPSEIAVFDFDERICGAVTRFADRERLTQLRAELYKCLDAFPGPLDFDCFYTNPPWGASNEGESVKVFVQRMMPQLHRYHLDDAPNLHSCNLVIRALPGNQAPGPSAAISDSARLAHFYGRDNPPKVRYIRERKRLDYGRAHDDEYSLELLE